VIVIPFSSYWPDPIVELATLVSREPTWFDILASMSQQPGNCVSHASENVLLNDRMLADIRHYWGPEAAAR